MVPHDPTDPSDMTPEHRLAEIASILAEGVLRLQQRAAMAEMRRGAGGG